MKLAIFDDSHTYGGAQVAAINLTKYVVNLQDLEVNFVVSKINKQLIDDLSLNKNLSIHTFGYQTTPIFIISHFLMLWKLPWLLFKISKIRPDVAIINMPGLEFGLIYGYILRMLGVRTIPWIHNPYTYNELSINPGKIKKLFSYVRDGLLNFHAKNTYKKLYTVSEISAVRLVQRLNYRKSVCVLRNVLPSSQPISPSNTLNNPAYAENALRLIIPGRVSFGDKGQDQLFKYLDELRDEHIDIIFYGDGIDFSILKNVCISYANVSVFGHCNDWVSNLRPSDIVVLPSRYDTQSLVALEAMKFGVRIIASDIPIFRDLLNSEFIWNFDKNNGFVEKLRHASNQDLELVHRFYKEKLKIFTGHQYETHLRSVINDS